MSLRERKKDKTRAQLQEAALDLIGRQGFAETTINQIAATVDVSPRTLLRYFPSKEDVIVSCVEDSMAIFQASLEARPSDEPPHVALMVAARALLAAYQERADYYLTIERLIAASPAIARRKLELSSSLAEQVTTLLKQRARSSAAAMLACEIYPSVIFALIRAVIGIWVAGHGARPLLDIFNEAVDLVRFESV